MRAVLADIFFYSVVKLTAFDGRRIFKKKDLMQMSKCGIKVLGACLALLLTEASISEHASAMPFNTDMFEVQPSADAVARKKAAGSISIGSLQRQKPDLTTDWVQKNPFTGNTASELRGAKGFRTNCSPCHGNFKEGVHEPAVIASKGMPSLDLSSEAVRFEDPGTNQKPKPDAHFFTYIFNGGVLMPAYGYKLSNDEIWDIVTYVRAAQAKAAELQLKK